MTIPVCCNAFAIERVEKVDYINIRSLNLCLANTGYGTLLERIEGGGGKR